MRKSAIPSQRSKKTKKSKKNLAKSFKKAKKQSIREFVQTSSKKKSAKKHSKKEQILSLFDNGISDLFELAKLSQARPSYVSAVLQQAGLLVNYFDLYTSSGKEMNIYSQYFSGKVGFKDEISAQRSVNLCEQMYTKFAQIGDRAGQHHALLVALTIFNRARWSGKLREAEIFRTWLISKLEITE